MTFHRNPEILVEYHGNIAGMEGTVSRLSLGLGRDGRLSKWSSDVNEILSSGDADLAEFLACHSPDLWSNGSLIGAPGTFPFGEERKDMDGIFSNFDVNTVVTSFLDLSALLAFGTTSRRALMLVRSNAVARTAHGRFFEKGIDTSTYDILSAETGGPLEYELWWYSSVSSFLQIVLESWRSFRAHKKKCGAFRASWDPAYERRWAEDVVMVESDSDTGEELNMYGMWGDPTQDPDYMGWE